MIESKDMMIKTLLRFISDKPGFSIWQSFSSSNNGRLYLRRLRREAHRVLDRRTFFIEIATTARRLPAPRGEQGRDHSARRRRFVERIEMDGGHAAREQVDALQRRVRDAEIEHRFGFFLAHVERGAKRGRNGG